MHICRDFISYLFPLFWAKLFTGKLGSRIFQIFSHPEDKEEVEVEETKEKREEETKEEIKEEEEKTEE